MAHSSEDNKYSSKIIIGIQMHAVGTSQDRGQILQKCWQYDIHDETYCAARKPD